MDGFAIRAIHPRPERRGFPLNSGKKFKERFLTTKPETIALHIANSIMRNKARIVFGNQATKTHIASQILPLKWLSKLSGKEIHGLDMEDDYRTDHDGFTIKKSSL
jgi:butyryl-CoA dehydrogenase